MEQSPNSSTPRSGDPWSTGRRPVLRFVLIFGVLLGVFNAFFYLFLVQTAFFEAYLNLNARVAAVILRVFGEQAHAEDASILAPQFALGIKRGCDALQASAFFAIGVLSSPLRVSFRDRLLPVIVGSGALLFLNLFRILTLYYTGLYFHRAFDLMHISVWQALFIFFPMFLWVLWARRVARALRSRTDVSA